MSTQQGRQTEREILEIARQEYQTYEISFPITRDKGLLFDVCPILRKGVLNEGSKGAEIYHEIRPLPNEKVILKHRYSAFYDTDLEMVLRNLGIDTTIICGTMTNYCCLSTMVDAFSRDFKIVFGSDINSTDNSDIQDSIVETVRRRFGRVLSCEEIIESLRGAH